MEMVNAQIILTKNLGLSKEEAFGVQEAFIASNTEANKGKDIVYDQIAAFANQNKLIVKGKQVFSDIAKTSKLIQINFNGNLGALVKTTLEAKKLGLSLDQVTKIGSSLLDFEQSISSELEAELLIGKDLNLEKARSYALNHDIAGLTQEITKQGITQEKFAAMNVIQQEALAKVFGMSAEEMGDMLYKAKVLEKVGGQDLKNKRKVADELERQGKITEAINLRNEIAQLEQGILSGKSLEEAEKSASAQEKFNKALEQAKEIFSDFIDGGYLDQLADAIKNFANLVSGGQAAANEAANLEKQRQEALTQGNSKRVAELDKLINEAQNKAEKGGKISGAAKGAEMGLAAAIGGLLLGTALDLTGVGAAAGIPLQAASLATIAGAVGISTAAGAGLGYATSGAPQPTSVNSQPTQQDFIVKSLPQDTVVGMGGTKLGRTDEMVQLLTEQNKYLYQLVNKEAKFILNNNTLGTGMAVGTFKTS
jgi:hypothetical protein